MSFTFSLFRAAIFSLVRFPFDFVALPFFSAYDVDCFHVAPYLICNHPYLAFCFVRHTRLPALYESPAHLTQVYRSIANFYSSVLFHILARTFSFESLSALLRSVRNKKLNWPSLQCLPPFRLASFIIILIPILVFSFLYLRPYTFRVRHNSTFTLAVICRPHPIRRLIKFTFQLVRPPTEIALLLLFQIVVLIPSSNLFYLFKISFLISFLCLLLVSFSYVISDLNRSH